MSPPISMPSSSARAGWPGSSTRASRGLMKKNKIDVHMGQGKLTAPGKLSVEADGKTTELTAKHIIIATGARARELPKAKADGKRVWTYRHAMVPPEMPTKLLVIGSGAIGIEFASFYNDLGAEVTVVEMMDRVVPVEDADVSAFLEKALKKQGMTILTSRQSGRGRSVGQGRQGGDQDQGRRGDHARVQPRHRRGRHRAQPREHRPRRAQDRAGQALSHQGRSLWPHQCPRRLGDRRLHRRAVVGAQGEPRGRHRRRGHRAGTGQRGGPPAPARPPQHPRLHLLPPADRHQSA